MKTGTQSQRMAIIGVGLIGGSLARALRRARVCGEIIGCSRHTGHLQRAVDLGVIDRYSTDVASAVKGADVVVIAIPLGSMRAVFQALANSLADDAVVTDVGSAKASVMMDARATLGAKLRRFVPGHPIAGTECSGVEASSAELFINRRVILTPTPDTDADAVERVRDLWLQTGAEVNEMTVELHDQVLAATSHLPHMVAYALVDALARMEARDDIFRFAAGGFVDFTRIASSDPQMWHDICLANQQALLPVLANFRGDLEDLEQAIRRGDGDYIKTLFTRAKAERDALVDAVAEINHCG